MVWRASFGGSASRRARVRSSMMWRASFGGSASRARPLMARRALFGGAGRARSDTFHGSAGADMTDGASDGASDGAVDGARDVAGESDIGKVDHDSGESGRETCAGESGGRSKARGTTAKYGGSRWSAGPAGPGELCGTSAKPCAASRSVRCGLMAMVLLARNSISAKRRQASILLRAMLLVFLATFSASAVALHDHAADPRCMTADPAAGLHCTAAQLRREPGGGPAAESIAEGLPCRRGTRSS